MAAVLGDAKDDKTPGFIKIGVEGIGGASGVAGRSDAGAAVVGQCVGSGKAGVSR